MELVYIWTTFSLGTISSMYLFFLWTDASLTGSRTKMETLAALWRMILCWTGSKYSWSQHQSEAISSSQRWVNQSMKFTWWYAIKSVQSCEESKLLAYCSYVLNKLPWESSWWQGCDVAGLVSSVQGGWEDDESVEEAACREAFEEAGVKGTINVGVSLSLLVMTWLTNIKRTSWWSGTCVYCYDESLSWQCLFFALGRIEWSMLSG